MLVDDHPLVRHGLSQLINGESDLVVCAEAASGEDALSLVAEQRPDLMVIDIALKGMNGVELIKRIRTRQPEVKMLVSSMHDETLYAERSLRAGARGYVNKEEAPENVIEAIRQVLGGNVFLSAAMKDRLLNVMIDGGDSVQQSPVENLSDRELEVFTLIGRGPPAILDPQVDVRDFWLRNSNLLTVDLIHHGFHVQFFVARVHLRSKVASRVFCVR